MTITGILRTEGDIPGVINHHAVMERNLTSDHILLKGGGIILERTEEVLPVTEVISKDMTRRRVQEINTDHMDLTVTMVMLLHTGVMEEGDLHHTIETVEGTRTATTIDQEVTEGENPVALETDPLMTVEEADRALDMTEGGQQTVKDRIADNHQLEITSLNSVGGQHQERVEMEISSAEDVEIKVTSLKNASSFPTGGEKPVTVVSFTKGETATCGMEHT